MTQKSILITGCSSGIGLCCARGMRDRGWKVLATARTDADLEMLRNENLEPIHLELNDQASITACAQQALKVTDGKLYALFNNAAFGQLGAVEDLTTDVLRKQFEANLFSWHELTRQLIPSMRANGEGRIIQCSSVLGLVTGKYRGAYSATKFALEGLTDAMRMELDGTGIKVSLIEPGPIQSRFVDHAAASLEREVDIENSHHADVYKVRLESLRQGGKQRFKLGPEAVLKRLVHACEASRPKLRYYVTTPTFLVAGLKRVLPDRLFQALAASN